MRNGRVAVKAGIIGLSLYLGAEVGMATSGCVYDLWCGGYDESRTEVNVFYNPLVGKAVSGLAGFCVFGFCGVITAGIGAPVRAPRLEDELDT